AVGDPAQLPALEGCPERPWCEPERGQVAAPRDAELLRPQAQRAPWAARTAGTACARREDQGAGAVHAPSLGADGVEPGPGCRRCGQQSSGEEGPPPGKCRMRELNGV